MSTWLAKKTRAPGRVASFLSNTRAAAAVEFALIALPFFTFVLCILQLGIYYFAQSALDTGVLTTAQTLYSGFRTGTTAYMPSASTLKGAISTNSGGMIQNDSGLSVEIQPMSNLSGGSVPITDGGTNYGTTTSTLVLRAQANVITFAPGFSSVVTSNVS